MTDIAKKPGQRRHSAAPHIAATATNENSPVAQPLITLDDIPAVIVQLHYHTAQANPEAGLSPQFLAILAEANAYYLEVFEPLGASAARASVTIND